MKPSIRGKRDILHKSLGLIALGVFTSLAAPPARATVDAGTPAPAVRQGGAGHPDPGFGVGGRVIVGVEEPGGIVNPQSALLPDGRILSVGVVGTDTLYLARHLPDGSRDLSFGQGGAVRKSLGIDGRYILRGRAVQPDGKLLLAGFALRPDDTSTLAYVRFTADGELDPGFGTGGIARVDLPLSPYDEAQRLLVQPDGRIVAVARSAHTGGASSSVLLRLTPMGVLDTTFGTGGISYDIPNGSHIKRVTLLRDGKLLLSGSFLHYALLSRYHADGRVDATFGVDGHLRLLAPGLLDYHEVNDVAVQDDGRIVLVGSAGGSRQASLIARVEAEGTGVDAAFNGGEILVLRSDNGSSVEEAVAVQADGRIVSLGREALPPVIPARLIRLNADGSFDTSFGNGGIALTDTFDQGQHLMRHLQVQADGNYLISGLAYINTALSLGMFRFLAGTEPFTPAGAEPGARPRPAVVRPGGSGARAGSP